MNKRRRPGPPDHWLLATNCFKTPSDAALPVWFEIMASGVSAFGLPGNRPRIWQRMAEDFAPFDVDITTEEPSSFDSRTGRCLITRDKDLNNVAMPGGGTLAATPEWR
jgi:hypothetical protein